MQFLLAYCDALCNISDGVAAYRATPLGRIALI